MIGERVTVPARRGPGPVVRVPATVTDSRLTRDSATWCTVRPDRGPVLEYRRDQLEPAELGTCQGCGRAYGPGGESLIHPDTCRRCCPGSVHAWQADR